MKQDEPYYIPMTLKDVADFINKVIRENPELNGNELIIGGAFITDDGSDVPPGSILFTLKKGGESDEEAYGTLVLMPQHATIVQ